MTSAKFIRYSKFGRRLSKVLETHHRCTAAFHSFDTTRAPKKDDQTLKKVDSYDYMSKMNEFDSMRAFIQPKGQERWKYEENVVLFSIACFFIHFFILREENQFDEGLSRPLYTTIPALELIDLGSRITVLKKEGKDFSEELARFEEVKKLLEEEQTANENMPKES